MRRRHQVSAGVFLDACRGFLLTPTQYGLPTALDIRGPLDQTGVGRILDHDPPPSERRSNAWPHDA